jgi:hypothetical protein
MSVLLGKLLGASPAVVAVATVAVLAMSAPTSTQADIGDVPPRAAAVETPQREPVVGAVPTIPLPFFDDQGTTCPGLELDAGPIPPYFETQFGPIPEPGPYEVCPLLEHADEASSQTWPATP